jgi:hypothetical protein
MSRPGDVDDPTKEYPRYAPGRAEPDATTTAADSDPAVGDPDARPDSGGAGGPETVEPPQPAGLPAARGGGLLRGLFLFGGVATLLVIALVGALALKVIPSFTNPFSDKHTDRSQPVLLQSMRDLSRFVGADGNFQVVVDLQDSRENVPEILLNQRTLFVAAGTVEAYVDFAGLSDGAIVLNADHTAVEVKLPAAQLGPAALDLQKSYVYAQQRGILNRIGDLFGGDPNREQRVYQLAQQRITTAAQDSGLAARAQDNTRKMLEGLLASLGYTSVKVTFAAP